MRNDKEQVDISYRHERNQPLCRQFVVHTLDTWSTSPVYDQQLHVYKQMWWNIYIYIFFPNKKKSQQTQSQSNPKKRLSRKTISKKTTFNSGQPTRLSPTSTPEEKSCRWHIPTIMTAEREIWTIKGNNTGTYWHLQILCHRLPMLVQCVA